MHFLYGDSKNTKVLNCGPRVLSTIVGDGYLLISNCELYSFFAFMLWPWKGN